MFTSKRCVLISRRCLGILVANFLLFFSCVQRKETTLGSVQVRLPEFYRAAALLGGDATAIQVSSAQADLSGFAPFVLSDQRKTVLDFVLHGRIEKSESLQIFRGADEIATIVLLKAMTQKSWDPSAVDESFNELVSKASSRTLLAVSQFMALHPKTFEERAFSVFAHPEASYFVRAAVARLYSKLPEEKALKHSKKIWESSGSHVKRVIVESLEKKSINIAWFLELVKNSEDWELQRVYAAFQIKQKFQSSSDLAQTLARSFDDDVNLSLIIDGLESVSESKRESALQKVESSQPWRASEIKQLRGFLKYHQKMNSGSFAKDEKKEALNEDDFQAFRESFVGLTKQYQIVGSPPGIAVGGSFGRGYYKRGSDLDFAPIFASDFKSFLMLLEKFGHKDPFTASITRDAEGKIGGAVARLFSGSYLEVGSAVRDAFQKYVAELGPSEWQVLQKEIEVLTINGDTSDKIRARLGIPKENTESFFLVLSLFFVPATPQDLLQKL